MAQSKITEINKKQVKENPTPEETKNSLISPCNINSIVMPQLL